MRSGFVTCVELGLGCMQQIEEAGGHLDLIVTLPDDKATSKSGRVWVDDFANEHGSTLVKAGNVNDGTVIRAVKEHQIDWLFVIGWSQIVKEELLSTPNRGVLGMHPTLLPQGRGRASIPWAILKGLPETGVTLFQLDQGVDTGPIVAQEKLPLRSGETATSLYRRVAQAHRTLIARHWVDLRDDRLQPVPQDEREATEWPGRTPEDGRITPLMTVDEADRLVRATTRPYPGAFWDEDGSRLRIWAGHPAPQDNEAEGVGITLADGVFQATELEWEGS